jgi:hypothetical protein
LGAVVQTSGAGSVFISSGQDISLESIVAGGGSLQIFSGGDLSLGRLSTVGSVYLQASGDIQDTDPAGNTINIIANSLAMKAGGKIGGSDLTSSTASDNRNAIGTMVSKLAAESSDGIYVQESDGLMVDSVVVSANRVNFNSTRTIQTQSLEDLTTTDNGPIKLQSLGGGIVVNAGIVDSNGITANGSGDVLLETLNTGSIFTNARVASDVGNITLSSADSLRVVDRLRTGSTGTMYLKSSADVTIETLEANNHIAVISGGTISLGSLDVRTGVVYLEAAGNIIDLNPFANTLHVTASALAMKAGGKIGDSDQSNFVDSNRNAIVTRVDMLAAQSATGIYIQESDGVTVDKVSVGVNQVHFNSSLSDRSASLEDLVTTSNGPVKLQSASGDILIRSGTDGDFGVHADGSGDILLQTLSSGTVITQAELRSGTGDITINSVDALRVTDHLRTSGPGNIYLTSLKDVTIESLNTQNVQLQVVSDASIRLGSIQTGTASVYLDATKDVLVDSPSADAIHISAKALGISAGGKIGASDLAASSDVNRNAIGTKIDVLAARSANGIYVRESDGLTVDSVSLVGGNQVHFNSTESDQRQTIEDLSTTIDGPIKVQSLAGDIRINQGRNGQHGILSAVAGDILLQTIHSGTVILNALVQTEFGDITILTKDSLVLGDRIRIGGPPNLGTLYLESQNDVAIEALTLAGSNMWVKAGQDIVLGTIRAETAGVYLDAQGGILNGSPVPTINVATRSVLAMKAGSEIGEIFTQVDDLAALAAERITITELDGVTIKSVVVDVDQVHFNSSESERIVSIEDLTTTNGGRIALRSLAGDIVIEPGLLGDPGIDAQGGGDVVLVTVNSGILLLRGDIVTKSGDVLLAAKDSVLIGASVRATGDIDIESQRGAIAELNTNAKLESDSLILRSATFAHLHDTTVNSLTAWTANNELLSSWQQLNLQASNQGDDFIDALRTVSESTKDALRAQYRFAERYQNLGYSLYLINSKELSVESVIAGSYTSGQGPTDSPGIYVETRTGNLIVKDAVISNSTSDQAGGVVLVSGSKVVLDNDAMLQSNYLENGVLQVQLINDIDLKARVFDALEKPNPAGGLFTTRIVSRNVFSESNLPEVPVSPGPTKRILQGVATHFGSAGESGFDLYIGYADGNLEGFGSQGDIYQRDAQNNAPVGSKPQAMGRVGYLERSTPYDGEFLNSVQELPTDVVIRRSDDFFIFQKEQPVGLSNFTPPNSPASTSTGFYDLAVQTHRVPDVISEGSENGLPMPPPPDTEIPTFRQPEPYTAAEIINVQTESAEYEDQPYQDRKSRIVVKRLVVNIVNEVQGDLDAEQDDRIKDKNQTQSSKNEEIVIPEDLVNGADSLSPTDIRKIREYLRLQPNTRQGRYEIIIETSDGTEQLVDEFTIGVENQKDSPAVPKDSDLPSKDSSEKPPEDSSEGGSIKENNEKPSNPNDQSLYLNPKDSTQAWSLALGSLWLARKIEQNQESEVDFSVQARRMRKLATQTTRSSNAGPINSPASE